MAVYCFTCECGHKFEALVSAAKADEPQPCPECAKPCARDFAATAAAGELHAQMDLRHYMDTKYGANNKYLGAQPSGGMDIKSPWNLAQHGGTRTYIPGDPKHVR